MKIAMVIAGPFPSPQGSQVFTGQMSQALATRGHRVFLLTYGQGRTVEDRGFVHERIGRLPGDEAMRSGPTLVKPLLDLSLVRALTRLVRREDIDLVHAHNYEAAVVGLLARIRTSVPVVYHSHNLMQDELATYFHRPTAARAADAAGAWMDRAVPRRADHTIALCGYTADALLRAGVAAERLSVIPVAAADDVAWQGQASARAQLSIPQDAAVLGYCGNLDGYQNLKVLLEAAALLSTRDLKQSFRFLVCSHNIDDGFRARITAYGLGRFATLLQASDFSEASAAIEACDVVALPRRLGSGYPVKLLNFMSAGLAIVTAGCGGKVMRDAVDAVVVPDDDPAAMAGAVAALLADPARRRALGGAARERFRRELVWDAVAPRIESVYAKVVERNAAAR